MSDQHTPEHETKLLPCPFCGGNNLVLEGIGSGCEYYVCVCGADGPAGDDKLESHDRWNERAPNPLVTELAEALDALFTNDHIDLGDQIYAVRDSECKGWDGPSVKAWSLALDKAVAALAKAKEVNDEG